MNVTLVEVPSSEVLRAIVTLGHADVVYAASTRLPVVMKCRPDELIKLTRAGVRWNEREWKKP